MVIQNSLYHSFELHRIVGTDTDTLIGDEYSSLFILELNSEVHLLEQPWEDSARFVILEGEEKMCEQERVVGKETALLSYVIDCVLLARRKSTIERQDEKGVAYDEE